MGKASSMPKINQRNDERRIMKIFRKLVLAICRGYGKAGLYK
jgi:hypothetical protein